MLGQASTQLAMVYYMDSKKHLPGRVVPLRVPFPGHECINVHVRTVNRDAVYETSGGLYCNR